MQTAIIRSATIDGINAVPVTIKVTVEGSVPSSDIIGLPEHSVRELRVGVRSAMRESDLPYPDGRVIVTVESPVIVSTPTALDLPIAIAILAAQGHYAGDMHAIYVGELSLAGELRPIRGAFSFAELARESNAALVCPRGNAEQAAQIAGLRVLAGLSLGSIVRSTASGEWPAIAPTVVHESGANRADMSDIRGQVRAIRGAEIAAVGGFSFLMMGTPGCGKTMIARRFADILPPMTDAERLEATKAHSVAGLMPRDGVLSGRPFRAPHHTTSLTSLLGGGAQIRPGEVTLATSGVLFLDELPEFRRLIVEDLERVIAAGEVKVRHVTLPAHVHYIAASNPCPCGWKGSPDHDCKCPVESMARWYKRLAPMIRNIDMVISLQATPPRKLRNAPQSDTSAQIQARVIRARKFATTRPKLPANASLVERIARAIADMDGRKTVQYEHVDEAVTFAMPVKQAASAADAPTAHKAKQPKPGAKVLIIGRIIRKDGQHLIVTLGNKSQTTEAITAVAGSATVVTSTAIVDALTVGQLIYVEGTWLADGTVKARRVDKLGQMGDSTPVAPAPAPRKAKQAASAAAAPAVHKAKRPEPGAKVLIIGKVARRDGQHLIVDQSGDSLTVVTSTAIVGALTVGQLIYVEGTWLADGTVKARRVDTLGASGTTAAPAKAPRKAKQSAFDRWLDTFLDEKEIDLEHIIEVEGDGGLNMIPVGVVVDGMKATTKGEQAKIKDTIVRIDFANGDVMHYFKHLAGALAH